MNSDNIRVMSDFIIALLYNKRYGLCTDQYTDNQSNTFNIDDTSWFEISFSNMKNSE